MKVTFTPTAWDQYLYWQETDKDILEKINILVKDCKRDPFKGLGKPEPLKNEFQGCWSRRITIEHRLIYVVSKEQITIHQCRFHYEKK